MASLTLFATYIFLIGVFYFKTDGFEKEDSFRFPILKTLPVLSLGLLVHKGHGDLQGWDRVNYALGLTFGALGDFLLALYEGGLIPGAIAFAVGHLFYMSRFAPTLKTISQELGIITLTYALFVNHFFLMPQLWIKPLSTVIMMAYAIVLCTAWVVSGSLYFNGTHKQPPRAINNLMRFAGYSLFFLSDSMLLLEEVGFKIPHPRVAVLSTYYIAQYLIIWGASTTARLVY